MSVSANNLPQHEPASNARAEPDADSAAGFEETLLQAHLRSRLDPHRGSARRRFEGMLAAGAGEASDSAPYRMSDYRGPRGGWNWRWSLGVLTAAAACVMFALGLWSGLDTGGGPGPVASQSQPSLDRPGYTQAGYTPLEYRESWQSQDLGTYMFEGRPVRAVHRRQLETTRYRDASGNLVQIEEPTEQLVLVDAPVQ